MNTTKLKLTIIGICGLILVPFSGHAATATLVNDNTVLFTIDFSFSDDQFDVAVPIMAEPGVTYLDRVDTVGYTIENESGNTPETTSLQALVLSRSAIKGTKYSLPTGTPGEFTLMILATFAEPITSDYRVTLTKLPYFLNDRRTTVHQNQLDDIEPALLEVKNSRNTR